MAHLLGGGSAHYDRRGAPVAGPLYLETADVGGAGPEAPTVVFCLGP
jgi:hypothetical protein